MIALQIQHPPAPTATSEHVDAARHNMVTLPNRVTDLCRFTVQSSHLTRGPNTKQLRTRPEAITGHFFVTLSTG